MPESLVKRHAEGVTHNTIGSVISTYIVQGVPLLISWLIAHLASLQGLPLYAIILLFLGAFALATLTLNQVRQFLRGRQSQQGALDSPGGQSDSDKALIDSQAHAGRLEQALTVARAHNEEYEWLVAIAKDQQGSIEQYIRTDCWIADHSLVEEPLFIDFRFSFQSSSLYKLTATGLSGSIRIGNRRLGNATSNNYSPRIESNELQDLALGQFGYLTITQPLTRADAVFILNRGADFMFDGLFIELNATPAIQRPIKLTPIMQELLNNKELREKYPKLDIKFKCAVYSYIPRPDRRGGDFPETISFDITLDVTLENLRNTKIEIDSVQVSLVNISQPPFRLQPDAGEIYERRFIDGNGVLQVMGDKLKNLASFPLSIIGRGKVSGSFQFTLENVQIGALKAKDTSASLVLTDKYGEHHVGNHDLDHF